MSGSVEANCATSGWSQLMVVKSESRANWDLTNGSAIIIGVYVTST